MSVIEGDNNRALKPKLLDSRNSYYNLQLVVVVFDRWPHNIFSVYPV